jgi:hypothetical protein
MAAFCCGMIDVIDGRYFVALDIDGTVVGRFQKLEQAVRVLPSRRSS